MIDVKICGLNSRESIDAAIKGGARYLGFVTYPKSPRHVTPVKVAQLLEDLSPSVIPVSVTVDADDDLLAQLKAAGIRAFQLHGKESAARVIDVKSRFGLPVIKAIAVSCADDIRHHKAVADASDMLLFDAKPPKSDAALPGGNGLAFDWRVLQAERIEKPWFLSGGLTLENVREAIALTGARKVDVSSGVESAPGKKDLSKVAAFLKAAQDLERV